MLLSETRNNKVNFLLLPHPYLALYNKLKALLAGEQYLFFAQPQILSDTTFWKSEMKEYDQNWGINGVKKFEELTDEERAEVADYIETMVGKTDKLTGEITQKGTIAEALHNEESFRSLWRNMFKIPDANSIVVLKTPAGLTPVLTQWGCKSNETTSVVDALSVVINLPRPDRAKVVVRVFLTDGTKAASKPFIFDYLNAPIKAKTNKDGLFFYGALRFGVVFKIYEMLGNIATSTHVFTINESETNTEGEFYANVIFPIYTSGIVEVVNQKAAPLADRDVVITNNDNEPFVKRSDKNGVINLNDLEFGKTIIIQESNNPDNAVTYTVEKDKNLFRLMIVVPIPTECTINVTEVETGNTLANYPVIVEYENETKEHITNNEGIINLTNLIAGKSIIVKDKNNLTNTKTHLLLEDSHENHIEILIPKPGTFVVKLIEQKHYIPFIFKKTRNLDNCKIEFITGNGEKITRITDENGNCNDLPVDQFEEGQKVRALIHIVKISRKGKKKEKILEKNFYFRNQKSKNHDS